MTKLEHDHDVKEAVFAGAMAAGHKDTQVRDLLASGLPISTIIKLIIQFGQLGPQLFVAINAAIQLVKGGATPEKIQVFVAEFGPLFLQILTIVAGAFGVALPTLPTPAPTPPAAAEAEEKPETEKKSHAHTKEHETKSHAAHPHAHPHK